MRYALVLTVLFCLLAISLQQQTIKAITSQQLSGEAGTKLSDIIVQVQDAAGAGVEGVTVNFNSSSTARTKIFCLPASPVTNKTGFASCTPLLGFSPGDGSMRAELAIPQSTQKLVFTASVSQAKFVMGWVQISIILAGSVACIIGAIGLAIWIVVCSLTFFQLNFMIFNI